MDLVDSLGRWPGAVLLQQSGTAYLLVNAAHILGLAMLVGGILPLDLRLIGFLNARATARVSTCARAKPCACPRSSRWPCTRLTSAVMTFTWH